MQSMKFLYMWEKHSYALPLYRMIFLYIVLSLHFSNDTVWDADKPSQAIQVFKKQLIHRYIIHWSNKVEARWILLTDI